MIHKNLILLSSLLLVQTAQATEFDISGYAGLEWREYLETGQFNSADVSQADRQYGVVAEPELVWSLVEGEHTIVFKPFARIDSDDPERTHGDIRELSWMTYGDDWEVTAGISKVYWGVAESQHLVDVINQTDFVEAPDGEDKLGQPMLKLTLLRDWGTLTGFVLPGFRERTFSGEEGRFRPALEIDTDNAQYEAGEEDAHVDYALRWSHTFEDYDVGLSWFQGTSRDPLLFIDPVVFANPLETVKLAPYYAQINQLGVDVQATLDSWLWKFEAIYRSYNKSLIDDFDQLEQLGLVTQSVENYSALTGGFEYTFYSPFETIWDLGVLTEYQYDSRADGQSAVGQNDLFMGSRIAFNDAESSELLLGFIQDLDSTGTQNFVLEMSTRLGSSVKFNFEAFIPMSDDSNNISSQFKRDDYVQLGLNYYY
jgi:hypothetical protein